MNVKTMTPVEIDTILAEIYGREAAKDAELTEVRARAARTQERIDAIDVAAQPYRISEVERMYDQVTALRAQAERAEREGLAIAAEAVPYESEYANRGGWTRAFLVDNTGGHVHLDRRCKTCHLTTSFTWLPEFSGGTKDAIVQAAGEQACTVCFPGAPVDVLRRRSTIEAPARKAARIERDAAKAERDAKKAAKAIANPDGSPLRDTHNFVIATERTAWNVVVDIAVYHRGLDYQSHPEVTEAITAALAAKTGRTVEQIREEIEAKVIAKAKRERITLKY